MSFKSTWRWLLVAGGLFAFIFFYQRHVPKGPSGPVRILPELDPAAVSFIQVRSSVKPLALRVERTNGTWTLTEPLTYPAQAAAVEKLLTNLAQLTPAAYLTESELRARPNADEEYGLAAPLASLILTQGNYRAHLILGNKTAPGDQVFLKVVAREGLFVVDADVLQCIPRTVDDWRDRDLLHLAELDFDRVAVTNNGKSFVVRLDSTNGLWRMVWPLLQARVDGGRVYSGLQQLNSLRVQQFVSDDPKADLDAFGLQSPDLELALALGTNSLALLQFGKSPSNQTDQVYARRSGVNAIVTVPKAPLNDWRVSSVNDFRDSHLLELMTPVQRIEVRGDDVFSLNLQTNGTWLVQPGNFAADGELVTNLLSTLTNMAIVQFAKDVVTPLNLPEYGLASPARQYLLEGPASQRAGLLTNDIIADLSFGFGTNQPDKVFARRADETSVYAVGTNDFAQLPAVSWQMRERRLWNFSADDLAGLTIRQRGKTRELIRRGDHDWSLGPGSQGIIEDAAIEESVRNLLQTPALGWVAVGATNRTRYGITDDGHQITFVLKNGQKPSVEFGGESPDGACYAAVNLGQELWILELPWALNRYVLAYLSLPTD